MEFLNQLFEYDFMQNAFWAALFTSISCGLIGTYVVAKRIVFISGGITHTSFGGIGIGYYLGINPLIGATVFAVLSALGIEYFTRKSEIRHDSMIGIFWSFGMAVGIIFVFLSPGYAPNLMSYLFGSILTVSKASVFWMAALSAGIVLVFVLLYKPILYIAFDETYAVTRKLPVSLIKNILMVLIALTIVMSIRVIGIILLISLLTIPQTIANLFTKKFNHIMISSVIIALAGSVAGLLISYYLDIPSGASIIFSLILMFIIARIAVSIKQKK
ncbi:MAG: metal ABC transporter permease [Bacteroidota bacterium]